MIGIFTWQENRERLQIIEAALTRRDLREEEREDLELAAAELQQWFMDVWRTEGGGAT